VLRVAFIGTGGIARVYLRTLAEEREAGRATLVAACDLVEERAREAARPFGAQVYTDWRRLVEAGGFDAAFVCVPPYAHEGQEEALAERGCHLFVAKPVALTVDYARRVLLAVRRAGVLASSGYMWRYNSVNEEIQRLLEGRPLGLVLGAYLDGLPGTPWWRDKAKSGGQMVEQTTHVFDLARYFAGEVVHVMAVGARRLLTDVPGMATEDVSVCNLAFASGAVGNVASSCALPPGSGRVDLELVAKDAVVRYALEGRFRAWVDGRQVQGQNANDPYADIVRSFLEAVRTGDGRGLRSPYADAAQTLAVTEAAERSLAGGGRPEAVEVV
jgi:predicted dehydrogenase